MDKHSVKDNGFEIGIKRDMAKMEEIMGGNKLCYYQITSWSHVLYRVHALWINSEIDEERFS